ncbi:transposase [Amniculibacterium sp. G2-70]|uniref:transposase n=1 Tax=Amniculibacterium sp. G2-70 TaxID=2767188 RepID=UPI00165418A5|nr:transposase [Amniculibacterium sp. G2-70]MBS1548296.1 transposase [Bacteroidota bacterium]
MRKILLLSAISMVSSIYGQTNCDALKKENEVLQSANKTLTSENEYLKKGLEINKPIIDTEQENSSFKITKVEGNKAEKNITISFLIETKDENKKMTIEDIFIVDIEGNEYKIDLYKSSRPYPELAMGVPMKLNFSFKDIQGEPLFIKLFRFKATAQSGKNSFEIKRSNLEFKDLKVSWN